MKPISIGLLLALFAAAWCVRPARGGDANDWTDIAQPGKLGEILGVQPKEGFLPVIDLNKIPNANPVGSGARAMGMASAFIAIADDATAASWNPGALVNLERPEVSLVGHWVHTSRPVSSARYPESENDNTVKDFDVNYASVSLPTTLYGYNMVFGLNFSRQYNFFKHVEYGYEEIQTGTGLFAGDDRYARTESYDVEDNQDGYLSMLSPAFALEITPTFSVGVAWNIWSETVVHENGWTDHFTSERSDDRWSVDDSFIRRDLVSETFDSTWDTLVDRGHNFNLGFLWNPYHKLFIGGVYKTPFTMDVEVRETETLEGSVYSATVLPPAGGSVDLAGGNDFSAYRVVQEQRIPYSSNRDETFHDEIEFPMIYGLGVAWRFNDAFTLSGSWMRTHWEDFLYVYDDKPREDGSPRSDTKKESFVSGANIEPGDTYRLGAEYLWIRERDIIPFRTGFFYDPEPGKDGLDDFWGVTAGSGYIWNRASLDIAYQYKWGGDIGDALNVPDGEEDHHQHKVMASVILYF